MKPFLLDLYGPSVYNRYQKGDNEMSDTKILTIIGASCIGFISGAAALYFHSKHKEMNRDILEVHNELYTHTAKIEDGLRDKVQEVHHRIGHAFTGAEKIDRSLNEKIDKIEQAVFKRIGELDRKIEISHAADRVDPELTS